MRKIRVLKSVNRTMQRLGYLKLLCVLVNETETSNINSMGKRLIERISKRIKLSESDVERVKSYVKYRLTDGIFRELRKNILENKIIVNSSMEIQDLYLSDSSLPSRTGRLVKANWRRYPYLATSLDLIKIGTYSAMTRSLVLLHFTPKEEINAFSYWDQNFNLMRISDAQAMVLLYCFIDNDADVIFPIFKNLLSLPDSYFSERQAITFLPSIFHQIIISNRDRSKTVEERDRLALITKTLKSIESWEGKAYTGGGAPQEVIRVRLEPYCDLGFLDKENRDRYEYKTTRALKILINQWEKEPDADRFLQEHFFSTFAASRGLKVRKAGKIQATKALVMAGDVLKSSLGYSPITDVGLIAGISLLTEKGRVLELARTTELLKELQKQDPEFVRFTVDRMGVMAYVKFLKSKPEN